LIEILRSGPRRDSANVATVYERLTTAILRGELELEAIINQGALAAALDDGRTPLPEVLRMLQRDIFKTPLLRGRFQ
jgi:DNA-binding GntR family transcriptional regulator